MEQKLLKVVHEWWCEDTKFRRIKNNPDHICCYSSKKDHIKAQKRERKFTSPQNFHLLRLSLLEVEVDDYTRIFFANFWFCDMSNWYQIEENEDVKYWNMERNKWRESTTESNASSCQILILFFFLVTVNKYEKPAQIFL